MLAGFNLLGVVLFYFLVEDDESLEPGKSRQEEELPW
jgi:hypothetical protein